MNRPSVITKCFLLKKAATLLLLSASIAAFATLGDGGRKGKKEVATDLLPYSAKNFSLRSNYNYRSNNFFAAPEKAEQPNGSHSRQQARTPRKPEPIEVTSPRLYVGNLSFDATESDLFELFNGVGHVQNAEVVSYKHNQRSKGFAFVQMQTVEEAKRAVTELHDKEFLGRKLVVSGAKSTDHWRN